jgi:hypothetical protein
MTTPTPLSTTTTNTFDFDNATIQYAQVVTTGYYDITADGAAGGGADTTSGVGAMATGDIYLQAGAKLEIVVGGAGGSTKGDGGGGGGSFVFETNGLGGIGAPEVIAGGGGGSLSGGNGGSQPNGSNGGGGGAGGVNGAAGKGGIATIALGKGGTGHTAFGGGGGGGYTGGAGGGAGNAGQGGSTTGLTFDGGSGGPAGGGGASGGVGGFGGGGGGGWSGGGGGGGVGGGGGGASGGGGGGGGSYVSAANDGKATLDVKTAAGGATNGHGGLINNGNGQITFTYEGQTTPCYCRGSLILTDKDEVAIERLKIGDIVVTASGERKPIKWIGWRDINCASHPCPENVWPVRVTAGAVAPGLPVRDLLVSPGHSLFLDGVLVPAALLVNGTTIVQERVPSVSYWHVELDRHDLLVAAGLAAESYLDCRNRNSFTNGGLVASLHPDFSPRGEWREEAHWAEHSCAPRYLDGPVLRGIRKSLARRAVELGARAMRDPGIQVLADGEVLTPVSVIDGRFRFEAPEDMRSLRLRSRSAVLAQLVETDSSEVRRLGVCVTKIVVDGRDIALDAPELSDGWHEVEEEAPRRWRWSNGDAELPIGRTVTLWLHALPAAYPLPPREPATRGRNRRVLPAAVEAHEFLDGLLR